MDNTAAEYKNFANILENNFDFYKNLWTSSFPTQAYLGKNKVLEWLPNENKNDINPFYKDTKILYHIDENGYRFFPDKINKKRGKKAFCFGCSYTVGHGLPDNETWAYQLGEKLGEDWSIYNFGKCGASIEEVTRIFYQVIKSVRFKEELPDAVFFLLPSYSRETYIGNIDKKPIYSRVIYTTKNNNTYDLEAQWFKDAFINSDPKKPYALFDDLTLSHDDALIRVNSYAYGSAVQYFFKSVMHIKIIQETCLRYNIPWYWYSWCHSYHHLSKEVIAEYMGTNTVLDDNGLKLLNYNVKNTRSRDNTHCSGHIAESYAALLYEAYKKDNI